MRLSIWIATALGLMVATAQVVVPPQGGSKKLTFLIALPYELNDSSGDLVNDIANSYRMMMSGMHIAAKVAERDVLMTYGIPDGLIDFVYINTWDPEFGGLDTYSLVDSGGYSANAVYEAIQSYNVIGIVGEILSRTTRFSAGVASYFQKPFCGATQGSVTLSEKKNYPYFFRQMSAKGTGKHFVAVLRYYGMKTLCVFRSTDDLSFSVAEEIKEAALKVGLNVVTVSFGEDVFRTNDFSMQFQLARRQRCRFIFASMDWVTINVVYDAGIKNGLVGPDYLWSSFNLVEPLDPLNKTILNEYIGFFNIFESAETATSADYSGYATKFWEMARSLTDLAERFPEMNFTRIEEVQQGWNYGNARQVHNCFHILFAGMQQLLQSRGLNGSWEQILNLGPSLNHTAFTRTPYIDPLGEYTNLNEYGDLEVPLIVLSTNETNVQNIHYLGDPSHAFGRTTEDGSSFIEYFKPTFYGGKLTPPKDDDDKVELDIVTEGSPHGIAIRLFQALAGLSITVMMAISLWRALTKVQRDAPPLWTWMVIVAGSLGVASTFWSIGSSAIQMCFVASLLFVEGVSIYLGCGLYLLVRRAWLYYNTEKMFRSLRVGRFALVIGMFMAVDACLVLFYRFSRYLASENKVCGPLRVTGQMDFRLALGIIHILGLCAVLALLVTFKPRRSSSTFDNIFKVTSVFLIAVIIFELILRPSKIQTVLEAVTLNAIPVFACVLVIIQKPEKPFPWDEEPKRVKVLRCNDMGKMRISIQGRFGWREERKYFVHLWNRSGLPWMTFTELDGTTTHRVDLAKLRSRDVYTDENPDPSDMVLEQMTVRNGILLMLPNSCIMLRLKTADGRDKMVGFLTGFARMNETKASQVSMLVGTGGSHREWKSELTGFDEA